MDATPSSPPPAHGSSPRSAAVAGAAPAAPTASQSSTTAAAPAAAATTAPGDVSEGKPNANKRKRAGAGAATATAPRTMTKSAKTKRAKTKPAAAAAAVAAEGNVKYPAANHIVSQHVAEVVLVVDRSGSMASYGSEGASAVQAAIDEVPAARGADARLTVRTFDNIHTVVAQSVLAQSYKLDPAVMAPRGSTALRDAVARAIEYADTLVTHKKVYVVIFTDGHDNSSSHNSSQVATMIAAARAKGVDFTWLAAGQAQMSAATSMGIDQKDVMEVGGAGQDMCSAMCSSFRKSPAGFSASDRASASPQRPRPTKAKTVHVHISVTGGAAGPRRSTRASNPRFDLRSEAAKGEEFDGMTVADSWAMYASSDGECSDGESNEC